MGAGPAKIDELRRTLTVELRPTPTTDLDRFESAVDRSAAAIVRALFKIGGDTWETLVVRWTDRHRNKFGELAWLSRVDGSMEREAFDRVVWHRLEREERLDLLALRGRNHPVWKLWRPKK